MTGQGIDLFGGRFDVVLDAGCASSCLRKLPVLNFVAGVAFGGSEVLGWDWTSSSGEMSSNGCFLKVDWGPAGSFNGSRLQQRKVNGYLRFREHLCVGVCVWKISR